jgi:peptidylprolyl isomerase
VRTKYTLAIVLALLVAVGCAPQDNGQANTSPSGPNAAPTTGLTDLKIEDVKKGTGYAVQKGDLLNMTYTGTLKDGTVFDSTDKNGGAPFGFYLGHGQVIAGWDQGLVGMQKGGIRKLSIPSDLAYGTKGAGAIPPGTDLYFEVKLLDYVKQDEANVYDKKILVKGTGPAIAAGKAVSVHYVSRDAAGGTITKASTYFTAGKGEIIDAMDSALMGVRQGSTLMLRIPPGLINDNLHPFTVQYFEITVDKVS